MAVHHPAITDETPHQTDPPTVFHVKEEFSETITYPATASCPLKSRRSACVAHPFCLRRLDLVLRRPFPRRSGWCSCRYTTMPSVLTDRLLVDSKM